MQGLSWRRWSNPGSNITGHTSGAQLLPLWTLQCRGPTDIGPKQAAQKYSLHRKTDSVSGVFWLCTVWEICWHRSFAPDPFCPHISCWHTTFFKCCSHETTHDHTFTLKTLSCNVCSKPFYTASKLKFNSCTHTGEKRFYCTDWIEHGLTSPPTQYRLYDTRFL